jgi:prepilin-type N-terminal cleavage/methylation domain-containing protein
MNTTGLKTQRGFTLVELLVAMVCTTIVLGGAVALTAQIQSGYRKQLEDSVGEQEARYALEWIGRYLRSVGNNPFNATTSACPSAGTAFVGLIPNTTTGALTLQSDTNPPDGLIGGASGACNQTNEHVTISLNSTLHEIQFLDQAVGTTATTRTDAVIDNLQFVYLDSNRATWNSATSASNIFYVQTVITIRSRTVNAVSGAPNTRTLTSEIRVRGR